MKNLLVLVSLTLSCMVLPVVIHAQSNMNNTSTMKKDCVKMQNGKVMQMKNGQSTQLTSDITLKDGKKVSSDGTVTDKNGKTWKLKEGESIDMNGMVKKGSMKKTSSQ